MFVSEVPEFKSAEKQPHNINVTEGEDISFYCDATGIPKPTVQWFKNGETIDRKLYKTFLKSQNQCIVV